MKHSAVLLGLAAGLASAAHHDHAHAHAHNNVRRGDDGTVTSWDVTTEWTYVTVTGPPAAGHTEASVAANPSPSHAAAVSSSPAAGDEVSAAAVTSAPASGGASDPIAIQNSKNAAQASINAAQQSANMAHQSSMLALQGGGGASATGKAATSAPVQPTSVAAVSSAVAPSVAPSSSAAAAPSGGAPSSGSCKGATVSTFMTYYGGGGALGSCGQPVIDDNPTVAMPPAIIGDKSICGSKMNIWIDGASEPQVVTITDTCPGCTDGHVDAAQGWALKVGGSKIVQDGHVNIKYCMLG